MSEKNFITEYIKSSNAIDAIKTAGLLEKLGKEDGVKDINDLDLSGLSDDSKNFIKTITERELVELNDKVENSIEELNIKDLLATSAMPSAVAAESEDSVQEKVSYTALAIESYDSPKKLKLIKVLKEFAASNGIKAQGGADMGLKEAKAFWDMDNPELSDITNEQVNAFADKLKEVDDKIVLKKK